VAHNEITRCGWADITQNKRLKERKAGKQDKWGGTKKKKRSVFKRPPDSDQDDPTQNLGVGKRKKNKSERVAGTEKGGVFALDEVKDWARKKVVQDKKKKKGVEMGS